MQSLPDALYDSGHSPGTGGLLSFPALILVAATLVVSKTFFILMELAGTDKADSVIPGASEVVYTEVWTCVEKTGCSFLLNICFSLSFLPLPQILVSKSPLGNVNRHFTFSPNAGSNITRLLLATRLDYPGGLDKIWDYKLLVYITDDNLLSGRKKAEALVETGTVTLSISVIPHPTTIVTTTPRVRMWGPAPLRSL